MQDSGKRRDRFAFLAKFRNAFIVLVLAALGAGAWFFPELRDNAACTVTAEEKLSPKGEYRAQILHKACTWGDWMGAASDSTLQVSMLSKPSWTRLLHTEDGAAITSFRWRSSKVLEVRLHSRDVRGVITRRIHELVVVYRYLKAPGNKGKRKHT